MKRITICLFTVLLIIPITGLSQRTITKSIVLHYNANDFTFDTIDGKTHISASIPFVMDADTLGPAIPWMCVNVLVAHDEQFEGLDVARNETLAASDVDMAPNTKAIPTNQSVPNKSLHEIKYGKASYPDNFAVYKGTHTIGGYRILSFLVSPLRYETSNHLLYVSSDLSLNIHLSKMQKSDFGILGAAAENSIKSIVVNPYDLDSLYSIYATEKSAIDRTLEQVDSCVYLIVTCDSLKDDFQLLADWKTTKGVKAKVVTVEDIYSINPSNKPMEIKQAIKDYYDATQGKLEYVLLGGGGEIVPIQYCCAEYDNDNFFYFTI